MRFGRDVRPARSGCSAKLQPEEATRVALVDLRLVRVAGPYPLHGRDSIADEPPSLLGIERKICAEQHVIGAEEGEPALPWRARPRRARCRRRTPGSSRWAGARAVRARRRPRGRRSGHPVWSSPPPIRPSQNGIMAPRWWVIMTSPGWRSKRPEKTRRPMATLVSDGQPNAHQRSYFDRGSPA